MMLWIILTVMTASAAILVAAPFLRRLDSTASVTTKPLAAFKDQLEEVDREVADGLIDPEQADAARNEIKRRALVADKQSRSAPFQSSAAPPNIAIIGIAAVVVLGSIGLYSINGRPELATVASDARMSGSSGIRTDLTAGDTQSGDATATGAGTANLASVDEMIERLALRLNAQPDDSEGWRMLGWSYASTQRFAEAADAYGKAVAHQPGNAPLQSSFGEALVRAANGQVTQQASAAFEKAIAIDPADPRARFFRGLAMEQGGDKREALEAWRSLLKDAAAGDDWAPDLEQRVTELAREVGDDRPVRSPNSGERSIADVRAAVGLPPASEAMMIRGMVDSLANRLKSTPSDADGWMKLMRSYTVLGETTQAAKALQEAMRVFADGTTERARILAIALELGITP